MDTTVGDVQQTVSSESSGTEQSQQQEEIQLTELLPVKQSRIRQNGELEVCDEADTINALKILREFTELADFTSNGLPFCEKFEYVKRGTRRNEKQRSRTRHDDIGIGQECNVVEEEEIIEEQVVASGSGKQRDRSGDEALRAEKRRRQRGDKDRAGGIAHAIADRCAEKPTRRRRRKIAVDSGIEDSEQLTDKFEESEPNRLSKYSGQMVHAPFNVEKDSHLNDEVYVYERDDVDWEDRLQSTGGGGGVFSDGHAATATTAATLAAAAATGASCRRFPKAEGDTVVEVELKSAAGDVEPAEKKYCCVVCEARFKGSGGLRNHYKIVHGAGPIFKCDECGKEFPLKERLKLHVRTHTGFKPYKCTECDKSFARGGQLVQHRRTHSQVKPYRCGLCSGTFTCAANLALHVKRHNGQKDHKCDICGRAFVRRDALKKHLECLHRDVKSFLCVICNKTFKGHLPQHMRTHARDRPHGCATCGQRFAQKSQLTVHQRTHSGQRPFRCLVCWQAFAHSTALKLHTRRHTGERPFKCSECTAGFTQLPHWKKHMKCIHGRNEPYACKNCKSFFRIKNDLECHEQTCHLELASDLTVAERFISGQGTMTLATTTTISTTTSTMTTTTTTTTIRTVTTATETTSTTIMTTTTKMNSVSTSTSKTASLQTITSSFANEIIVANRASCPPPTSKYKTMTVERMRLLIAVLLKRISKQERLDELGFGKRLIDEVLYDSLISAGKDPARSNGLSELDILTRNLEIFLKWTVPKEHWENFQRLKKSPEDILETLTAT